LEDAPAKFRRKERTKFLLFLFVTAANLVANYPELAGPGISRTLGADEL
jgi:hypothetical protein